MTLSSLTSRISYPGTGSAGPFAYSFRILSESDLLVTKRQSSGNEIPLIWPADFTVTGVQTASGTITLTTALKLGETLAIRRAPALAQPTSIRNQGTYFPATIEDEFDRLVMQMQSLKDQLDRSVRLNESYDPLLYDVTIPPGAPGQMLGWDVSGTALVAAAPQAFSFLSSGLFDANVKDPAFAGGAKGDASANDTAAFNAALNALGLAGGSVFVPPGTYMIDADWQHGGGVWLLSNTRLVLSDGATMQAITNSVATYAVVIAMNVSKVGVYGGTVLGERSTHIGGAGEWGHCIQFGQTTDGVIEGTTCKDAWGDGIYIGAFISTANITTASTECVRPTLRNVRTSNARRNGCSITAAKDYKIIGSRFNSTIGTSPQAGLDLEQNASQVVKDGLILGCSADDNAFYGFALTAGDGVMAIGNSASRNASYAMSVNVSMLRVQINGLVCVCNSATSYGLNIGATGVWARGIDVSGSFTRGINLGGATRCRISDFKVAGAVNQGIYIDTQSDNNSLSNGEVSGSGSHGIWNVLGDGNEFNNLTSRANGVHGLFLQGSRHKVIGGNYESNVQDGIKLLGAGSLSRLSLATCRLNGTNGVELTSVDDCQVEACTTTENSQTTDLASYGIRLTTGGNRNTIARNTVRVGGTANRQGHGINVSAGVNTTRVVNNDTATGGAVREINDSGTDTFVTNNPAVVALTYAATMTPQPFAGQKQLITVTNGTAMTIAAPGDNGNVVNYKGLRLTFEILNSSGGVMGVVTWNAAYKLAGAFVNPANTFRRTITFVANGTNWVEESRAAAEI